MIKNLLFCTVLFLGSFLFSCKEKEKKEILVDHLGDSDFEDILTVDGVIQAVRSVTLSCSPELSGEIVYLVEDGSQVQVGDLVCQIENREYQDIVDQLQIEIENAKANMTKTKANLDMRYAQLDAQVKINAIQTAISNLDSLQLIYASPQQRRIKELELQKAAINKNKLTKKLQALDIINKNQIKRMELQIKSKENRAEYVNEILSTFTIKATQSGMALRAVSWITDKPLQEGDAVQSAMPVVTIPDMTEMKVRIQASEASYKRMNVGDRVEYTFDGMPGNVAWGKIQKKAPVGQPIKRRSQVKVFEVEASMDSSKVLPRPGLSVTCNIIIQQVKDTIVVPQLAIFEEDSLKMVYVKQLNGFERRQVLLGPSSAKNAVITSGLTGKEVISLNKPASISIKKTTMLPVVKAKKTKPVQKTKTK